MISVSQIDSTFFKARDSLLRLESIMAEDGEDNWINCLRGSRFYLEEADEGDVTAKRHALDRWTIAYRQAITIKDGFSDFMVTKGDVQSRAERNSELDKLRDALWEVFIDNL